MAENPGVSYLAGVDNSYAEKVGNSWTIHGAKAVDRQGKSCHFYKLQNTAELSSLPDDVPIFASWTDNTTIIPTSVKPTTKHDLDKMATDALTTYAYGLYPINQHNTEIVAQSILEQSDIKNYRTLDVADGSCLYDDFWNVIDDLKKGQNGRFQALDGWFLDPRIKWAKSKLLVRDESIETKTKDLKTVADYLKDYEFYSDRQLNPEFLNWNLELDGFQRLDSKRTVPRYTYTTPDGTLQTISEHKLLQRAIELVENRYADDDVKTSALKVLKQKPYSDYYQAQRLKLATQIVEKNDRIKLVPIEKGLADQVEHLVRKTMAKQIQPKAKER